MSTFSLILIFYLIYTLTFSFFTFYFLNKFLLLFPSPATWLSFTSGWSPASQAPHLGETKKINTKPKQTKWLIFFVFSVIGKFTSTQDNCDEGGNRPNGPHHPHPLHVLPLHELVRGQGGHLQRVHGQVLAHIHGDLENIMKSWNQISKIYFRLRWAAVGGFLLRHSTSPLSLHTIGLKILPWKLPMKILPWEYSHENTWKCSHVNTSHNQCEWNLHQLTLQDPFQRGSRVRLGFHPLYHQEARGGGWGGGEREVRVVTAWCHGSW